ncbi:MAG: Rne/Rng family ribonuclease, partial [Nocardioidaceae bacterium]
MLNEESTTTSEPTAAAGEQAADSGSGSTSAKKAPGKRAAAKKTAKKATKKAADKAEPTGAAADAVAADPKSAAKKTAKKATKKTSKKAATDAAADGSTAQSQAGATLEPGVGQSTVSALSMPLFKAPDPEAATPRKRAAKKAAEQPAETADTADTADTSSHDGSGPGADRSDDQGDEGGSNRRRRSRGGRNRRKSGGETEPDGAAAKGGSDSKADNKGDKGDKGDKADKADEQADDAAGDEGGTSRRRRRRRRPGEDAGDDSAGTTTRVRQPRAKKETITSVEGSTRIEAKKQRRREGREAGRRRPPILSESEFLARRESVERVMAIRQRGEVTQIAVLEDNILVEHYVALESQSSIIGNVYLGRVQNVLPSMEAAFIDIGKGRNAVLYAGEVNWDLRDDRNQPRRIENALKPGQSVLVQVSKDPIGHKGARLTSQISLPGRYLVYVPGGGTSGISRKLPDTERNRLKNLLKDIIPEEAGVIIRTAAEGASEDELTRDVTRLTARWEDIEKKSTNGQAPQLLYAEPDTTLRVVRDLFTEDFAKLVISGDDAWDMVDGYVQHVAPDLIERLERFEGDGDVFSSYRIDEQIAKALERKVWLPSGGSLVIDRTEAMTVVDVNTGKFTGSGGNLEETVTKNNLEAAEEIVRQLRLRDIGGIIVIDFIDMVLENNRDLVLRRLVECLGRDRTRHQVAEVTSLGLIQMTRKRISTGLLEAFSHACEHCQGRGVVIEGEPVGARQDDHQQGSNGSRSGSKRSSNRRRGGKRGSD